MGLGSVRFGKLNHGDLMRYSNYWRVDVLFQTWRQIIDLRGSDGELLPMAATKIQPENDRKWLERELKFELDLFVERTRRKRKHRRWRYSSRGRIEVVPGARREAGLGALGDLVFFPYSTLFRGWVLML